MTGAPVVAVLDALEAVVRAVDDERPVYYGPVQEEQVSTASVATWLAYADTGEDAAVTVEASPAQEDGSQELVLDVACAVGVYSGGSEVRADLLTAETHLGAIRAAINADRVLGGVAMNTEFGTSEQLFMGYDDGVRVLYLFRVRVTTWS